MLPCCIALLSAAQWEVARRIYDEMRAASCRPDVVTFTTLIAAYEHGGQWQTALGAFADMLTEGLVADAIVYNGGCLGDVCWKAVPAVRSIRSALCISHQLRMILIFLLN